MCHLGGRRVPDRGGDFEVFTRTGRKVVVQLAVVIAGELARWPPGMEQICSSTKVMRFQCTLAWVMKLPP
jgi:hypothetical protein